MKASTSAAPSPPRGAIPPKGADPPGTICRFAKRTLDKMSWLAPLVNNSIGDLLNLELRHEQLFFIAGEQVVDDIGYNEKSQRFSEADFGKPIRSLDEMRRAGYWLVGRSFHAATMREALGRQQDGYYYNFLSNQCQDWADRLKRNAERVERERGVHGRDVLVDADQLERLERFTRFVPPTEPASMLMGFLSLCIGGFALASPLLMAEAFDLVLGLVFVASGLAHIIYGFHARDWRNLLSICLIGVLYLSAGVFYLVNRNTAVFTSSTLVAVTLGVQGLLHVGLAARGRPPHRWAATLGTGLVMLAAAGMVWWRWPASGDLFFGLMVGACMIAGGLATIWLSWRTRHEEDHPESVPALSLQTSPEGG